MPNMESIIYILLAVLSFGFLVFIHELGHYIMARREGLTVEVFSIGFGKPLFKWKFQGVQWQVALLPFGGFVKIKGMDAESDHNKPEEKDSFFGASSFSRLKVAFAGPIVNIAFAFICFSAIWFAGGRQKPFAENTKIVGYVEKGSKLSKLGLKPGDQITQVGGRSVQNFKDILESTILLGSSARLQGFHIDETSGDKIPFDLNYSVQLDPDHLKTSLRKAQTMLPAQYLILRKDQQNHNSIFHFSGSPLSGVNYKDGDRLLWVDGQIIYNTRQLQEILRSDDALVTVQRGESYFTARVPRKPLNHFFLSDDWKGMMQDVAYNMEEDSREMISIPYTFCPYGYVTGKLTSSFHLSDPLQKGDRIVAVDGKKVETRQEILEALKTHEVSLVLQTPSEDLPLDWKKQDQVFYEQLHRKDLHALVGAVGLHKETSRSGLTLYTGLTPKKLQQFAQTAEEKEQLNKYIKGARARVLDIYDPDQRKEALQFLDEQFNQPVLGLLLDGKMVQYNPTPMAAFTNVYQGMYRMLGSMVSGTVSPKFLSGPVGMLQMVHTSFGVSLKEGLFWLAIISLNLGLINLLPIPVLDGGYICLSMYEIVTRRRISPKAFHRLAFPFIIMIISIFIFSTFQDLSRLFGG